MDNQTEANDSLSIRPSLGVREEEISQGQGGQGKREERLLSLRCLFFLLLSSSFPSEMHDTQSWQIKALEIG